MTLHFTQFENIVYYCIYENNTNIILKNNLGKCKLVADNLISVVAHNASPLQLMFSKLQTLAEITDDKAAERVCSPFFFFLISQFQNNKTFSFLIHQFQNNSLSCGKMKALKVGYSPCFAPSKPFPASNIVDFRQF